MKGVARIIPPCISCVRMSLSSNVEHCNLIKSANCEVVYSLHMYEADAGMVGTVVMYDRANMGWNLEALKYLILVTSFDWSFSPL